MENIVSDEDCKTSPSPITFSSIYGGEDYNATLEQIGWSTFGFDDSKWQKPVLLGDMIGKLVPEEDYPLKVFDEFLPLKISTSKTGRTIYDFGQNASGIISLKVRGNRGTQIIIRPDELINEEGNITHAYKNIIIAPKPVGDIKWSKCSYISPQGVIVSEWELVENRFSLTIEVPETSSAKIIIPDNCQNSTVEVINLIDQKLVDIKINEAAFKVKSGKYKIHCQIGEI